MKRIPSCKCGKPCAWYGLHGGFSVACIACNEKKARQSRESRARIKAERIAQQAREQAAAFRKSQTA